MRVNSDSDFIVVGQVGAPHGVKGWVKIHSFTEHTDNLLDYQPWFLGQTPSIAKQPATQTAGWQTVEVLEVRELGKGLMAHFQGVDDRDAAAVLRGRLIAIGRDQLPEPEPGEYYWVDLPGLRVETLTGVTLGVVDHLLETGANDVLVVKGEREHLIPYVRGPIIKTVDLEQGLIRVDWDPDYD